MCVSLGALILKDLFKDLENLFKPTYNISITLISAFINASSVNILRLVTRSGFEVDSFLPKFFDYMTGDTLGVFLIVFSYIGIRRLFYLSVTK